MIIVRLIGGLGNQLFQYAIARHIAEIHGTVLKLDISGFETYKLHKYSLWPFNIQENFASPEEVAALTIRKQGIPERVLRRALRCSSELAPTYIREKHFHFDPEILNLPDGIYLEGYWQSEMYFKHIESIIRQEFTVKTPQEDTDKRVAEQITSCQSVSLHIRRQDYVSNIETKQAHGICGVDYFLHCVGNLIRVANNPHFFVFSDEPEWARDNLELFYETTFVHHNGADKNYEDLRLMSQCNHHIISNSTFSWWGAWLNQHSEKVVLAPRQWFGKERQASRNMNDLLPDSWVKL